MALLGLSPAYWVVLGHAAAVLLGGAFFRRYRVARPPVGVFDLGDVALLLGAVVLAPLLYLALPRWAAAGLLGLGVLGALLAVLEPVLGAGRGARLVWPLALALLAADAAAALHDGAPPIVSLAVNNAVLLLAVVGVANLWAQSGLKARDAAVLAGALAIYDAVATAWLPLTDALLGRLAGLPFAPLVAWPVGPGGGLGVGLGDLLLATVCPLALRKAYGRRAGRAAAAIAVATLAGLLALLDLGLVRTTIPAMVVLGPLTVAQYLLWRRRGRERTTWEYLQAEPLAEAPVPAPTQGAPDLQHDGTRGARRPKDGERPRPPGASPAAPTRATSARPGRHVLGPQRGLDDQDVTPLRPGSLASMDVRMPNPGAPQSGARRAETPACAPTKQ